MSTLSSVNVTDVNLVLKERTHKLKMKYSMQQYSNSYTYFRQLAYVQHPDTHTSQRSNCHRPPKNGSFVAAKCFSSSLNVEWKEFW